MPADRPTLAEVIEEIRSLTIEGNAAFARNDCPRGNEIAEVTETAKEVR